ncbi:hypothetical protein CQW23_13717 [Capsicum baccatum]|uniref:Uncharacterized protein n=1 Tax=Capsicum baccatum TaxID=33114 RepID=A0A2G2WHA8_CAPBA|nr:hypothetical protein CQW23_13717 [Capsicum baccatum]
MTAQRRRIEVLLRSILYDGDSSTGFKSDMHHVLPRFVENIDDSIRSCHHSTSSTTMTEEQLNFLLVNLHHLSKHQYLEEHMPSLVTQHEILQNVCGNVRDFHGLILNGCIEHDNVEHVLPQFQRMAERVGLFLWDELILEHSSVFKLAHLLMKIFPIELEVMKVCFTNLKASTSAEVGRFIKQLLEACPDILSEYLIHLQEHMFSDDIDVADKLRKQLYGKRYLIVLDDVWDTTTWDELTRPFPNVEKGSRIILTTREKKVAFHGKCNTDPLNLRLLRPEESWELLEKRAFGNESCPDELLDVGKEIVQNCKGLPLVVDLIAGVIAVREKKKSVWLEVRNDLSSFIFNSEVNVMVIELSYDHLSHHLKTCLIYLACFRKDTVVERVALKMYWRAEGLVQQTGMKSLEEVMEIYLDNLISSSLVIAFNEIGDNPTCQLHYLVHDFCLIKSREEKFFGRISSGDLSSSSDLMPCLVTIVYNKEHFGPNNFVLLDSKMERHSGKHLYSLAITRDKMEDHLPDACHLRDVSLLRV